MTRKSQRTLASAGLLAIVAGSLFLWAVDDSRDAAALARNSLIDPPVLQWPGPLAAYEEIAARTLFTPQRRPPAAPVLAAAAAQDSVPFTGLVAVAIGPDRRAAILQLASGRTAVLMQGETVDGWVLSDVSPGQVTLRSASGETALRFPVHAGSTQAGPAP
jgi:hypothetical protein